MNLTSWYELRDHKGRLVESGYALTFEQEMQSHIDNLQAILDTIAPPKPVSPFVVVGWTKDGRAVIERRKHGS